MAPTPLVICHTGKLPEEAVAALRNEVLPQFEAWGLKLEAILTDKGREFCGRDSYAYELYLMLNDIRHRTTRAKRPQTNGFCERFHRTVKEEFYSVAFRKTFYESLDQLQRDLDHYLSLTIASAPTRATAPRAAPLTKRSWMGWKRCEGRR